MVCSLQFAHVSICGGQKCQISLQFHCVEMEYVSNELKTNVITRSIDQLDINTVRQWKHCGFDLHECVNLHLNLICRTLPIWAKI